MPTIVIVDDCRASLNLLTGLVRLLPDCRAVGFTDSAEGLEWCLDNEPDLVLVDYEMPHPHGLLFIELLRGDPRRTDIPVIMVTACASDAVRHRALLLGASDFLTKPVNEVEFLARSRNLLRLRAAHRALACRAETLAQEVERATRDLRAREREAVLFLSRAAEHRDPETADHLVRMACYARLVGQAMGLPAEQVELIHAAAPMHDIGKIGVPDRVLLKPGKLDADEFEVMRQHTVYGHRILEGSNSALLRLAGDIALCHHERYDGGGYPRRLAGEAIPLAGRIVAVADVFDALTSRRPYKEPWPFEQAWAYVLEESGRHFDPDCVAAFQRCEAEARAVCLRGGEVTGF